MVVKRSITSFGVGEEDGVALVLMLVLLFG